MAAPIRANVLRMRPFPPGPPIEEIARELGLERIVRLASNEHPLGPSPKAVEAVKAAAGQIHLYPDALATDMREAIGKKFSLPAKQVIVGNGSDELIQQLGLLLLGGEEDEIIVGEPSFVRYDAAAELAPCRIVKVPVDENGILDLRRMAEQVSPNTKIVFIANPNNPTGTVVLKPDLDHFLQALPDHVVTVLDEAYFDFASDLPNFPDSVEYVRRGKQVVGLRTFSKTYGLAGLRIGYGFAPPDIAGAIERIRSPFNVNSLAQVAAQAALSDHEHLRRSVEFNRQAVERITKTLTIHGGKTFESFANFVYVDFGLRNQEVFQELLNQGVLVRLFANPSGLRVSTGTEEDMDVFEEAMAKAMISIWGQTS